jgi:hypothetical protein
MKKLADQIWELLATIDQIILSSCLLKNMTIKIHYNVILQLWGGSRNLVCQLKGKTFAESL